MAQAARLNLRMQKEIKLLLTDPPPGVSVPMLSGDSDLSSLSIIDAQVEGPEGSVYAKGIFNIKIQIPERYPFQPPIVTFSTPIYHPNIDNGGRICLDILNVPPKGAWLPSLNISTVLTSIGLLLSEPNPDDGLMCEVSKEYKYNRQAFDQNARSLTERYAKPGASGNGSGSRSIPTIPISNMIVVEEPAMESKDAVNEYVISHKKLCGISRKLSLESLSSTQKRDHDKENSVPTHQLFANAQSLSMYSSKSLPMTQATNCDEQLHQDNDEKTVNDSINMNSRKLCGIHRKLSLKSVGSSERRDGDNKENQLLISQCQSNSTAPLKPLSIKQVGSCDDEPPHQDTGGTMLGYKKVSGISQKLSLESLNPLQRSDADDKENMVIRRLSCIHPQNLSVASSKSLLALQTNGCDEQHHHQGCDEKIGNGSFKHQVEASPIIESVIVLDSEDSEEERKGPMKSRLSLSRKRLAGKLKAKACT